MANEKINEQSKVTMKWTEDGGVHISGNDADVKKIAFILGESFWNAATLERKMFKKSSTSA